MSEIKTALTIAGSDPSGGAGIQADLKTFTGFKVYGMSVITSLTAQNTKGVSNCFPVPEIFVKEQLDSVFTDIFPDAVKIGMLSNEGIINTVSERLNYYKAENVVLDTVILSTSGYPLLDKNEANALIKKLFPLSLLITPNINEAYLLNGIKITDKKSAEESALKFKEMGVKNVLIKGGHFKEHANDLLLINGELVWLKGNRLNSNATHGTGCTLSSAIASNLALGLGLIESVKKAKEYVYNAIKDGFNLGNGIGPLNHFR